MVSQRSFGSNLVVQLANCDFFAGNTDNFFELAENTATLAYGKHSEIPPFLSIVITTYKRPEWLKTALESALHQKDFSNYQILVVDNEGSSLDEETETSRLVCSYSDDKIIYYRNFPTAYQRTQTAVSLVRSKWFCILHDDDFLAENHLKTLTDILHGHPEILYLACTAQGFASENEAECLSPKQATLQNIPKLTPYPAKSACAGCYPGWLGALISKEHYVTMGGMYGDPPVATSINDYIMVLKFMARHGGVYKYENEPLYWYRQSMSQDSALEGVWGKAYIAEFFLYRYMAQKYHPFCSSFWQYIGEIVLYEKIESMVSHPWLHNKPFDFSTLCAATGMTPRTLKGVRFALEKRLLSYIQGYYHYGLGSQALRVLSAFTRRIRRLTGRPAEHRSQ